VLIAKQYAYRGAELVVIPQPDGSVACIRTIRAAWAPAGCDFNDLLRGDQSKRDAA